jgi:regulator of sigma E protease
MTLDEQQVAFHYKKLSQRAAVVVAGPLANFLFAIVLLAGLFSLYGQPYSPAVIGGVVEGGAAEAAGMLPGDRILSVNGRAIERFEDVANIVQLGLDEPLVVVIERGGEQLTLSAQPTIIEETDLLGNKHRIGRLGISSSAPSEVMRYDPLTAVWQATKQTYELSAGTLKAVGQMLTGTRSSEEIGGVLRIAQMSGEVTQMGFASAVFFAAVLSINLGLINLFPVPMLDGGHLAFYAFEALRGRPLGARAQEWGFRIGLVLVLALFVFATRNDLMSFPAVARFIERLIT